MTTRWQKGAYIPVDHGGGVTGITLNQIYDIKSNTSENILTLTSVKLYIFKMYTNFIHPFMMELIPAAFGHQESYTLDKFPAHCKTNITPTLIHRGISISS